MNDPLGDDHLKIKQIMADTEARIEEIESQAREKVLLARCSALDKMQKQREQVLAKAKAKAQKMRERALAEAQDEIARMEVELAQHAQECVEHFAEQQAKQLAEETTTTLRVVLVTFVHTRFPTLTEMAQAKAAQVDKPDVLSYLLEQLAASSDENEARLFLRPSAA